MQSYSYLMPEPRDVRWPNGGPDEQGESGQGKEQAREGQQVERRSCSEDLYELRTL